MPHLKIIGTSDGKPSPFDGMYLKEYDPERVGFDPWGRPMLCRLICTKDPALALDLPADDLIKLWHSGPRLKAFTVEIGMVDI